MDLKTITSAGDEGIRSLDRLFRVKFWSRIVLKYLAPGPKKATAQRIPEDLDLAC